MKVLEAKNLTKIYGMKNRGLTVRALDSFSITVEKGEFIGVMGPSGSGKTTLLNLLATIDVPSSGQVLISGTDPAALREKELAVFRRRELGFIFQDFNLLDTLSIKENIILPLVLDGMGVKEIEDRVLKISGLLNIRDILDKRTYEVSGGEQQRSACARALIHDPSVIFADEPTGNLDSRASYDIMESLTNLNEKGGATVMMVTHDPFAASFCHRIVMIKDGKFFTEINRGSNRQAFFQQILGSLSMLGGNYNEVL